MKLFIKLKKIVESISENENNYLQMFQVATQAHIYNSLPHDLY